MIKVGFIGTGNMGGALAAAAGKNPEVQLLLANRHPEKAKALADKIGAGILVTNEAAAEEADILFLGVKPQMLGELAPQIKDTLQKRDGDFLLVSMLAGTAMEKLLSALEIECPVIRIMPNIPVSVGEGLILYAANALVSPEQKATFLSVMAAAGRLSETEERLIDAGSAVSGCGPAFAALFIEALADGGVRCGLKRAAALELAAQTLLGSAKLMQETGRHPEEIKDAVCSPGGTTIAGVLKLEEMGFRSASSGAVIAAYERTLELKK